MNENPLPTFQDIVQKIETVISPETKDTKLFCYSDGDGNRKCFVKEEKNGIKCKDDECFVSYTTVNQNMIGKGKAMRELGLEMLMLPNGLSTTVTIVGSIPRKKVPEVAKIIGREVKIEEGGSLPILESGVPDPPSKCHWMPISKDCSPYLNSDHFTWIPGIGMKKVDDIIRNPKTIFKSEIKIGESKSIKALKYIFSRKKPEIEQTTNEKVP